jgi:hypothetical protein
VSWTKVVVDRTDAVFFWTGRFYKLLIYKGNSLFPTGLYLLVFVLTYIESWLALPLGAQTRQEPEQRREHPM